MVRASTSIHDLAQQDMLSRKRNTRKRKSLQASVETFLTDQGRRHDSVTVRDMFLDG